MKTFETGSGFTLIETAATLTIISLVAVGLIGISDYLLSKQQTDATNSRLDALRRAINGNPLIAVNEARTSFGYLGDMGKPPTSLQDLWVKGSQPGFSFDSTKKAGAGWNGPYLDIGPAELASTIAQDGWGNPVSYSTSPFVDSSFGATVLAKLASLGPDFSVGTSDDISINFFQSELLSRVQGYVKDTEDTLVSGVGITLNYPLNGTVSSQAVLTDSTGYYSIPDIPFGNRSITIEPKLVLAPGTTIVSGNGQ